MELLWDFFSAAKGLTYNPYTIVLLITQAARKFPPSKTTNRPENIAQRRYVN